MAAMASTAGGKRRLRQQLGRHLQVIEIVQVEHLEIDALHSDPGELVYFPCQAACSWT
jgi:hypothetical protein